MYSPIFVTSKFETLTKSVSLTLSIWKSINTFLCSKPCYTFFTKVVVIYFIRELDLSAYICVYGLNFEGISYGLSWVVFRCVDKYVYLFFFVSFRMNVLCL